MNQKKVVYALLAVLLVLAAGLSVLHLTTRDAVPEGAVAVDYQGKRLFLTAEDVKKEPVTGTLVNGKGQEVAVDAMGAGLQQVLEALQIDISTVASVRVTAQDEFSAEVTASELLENGKVFLTFDGDSVTLVVFGDSNSKRNVRNVAHIEVICP